ncbi:NADH oxidase [Desulfosarcina widdelii]|uniref:NADH oxidase n=1 Tax=Desulfosarcina widdelii TaxID=947919 RepID=A0A5K7YXH5_9BACT|nr:FAD-dependent oxidoreductase [Desulfosarcina widdelii]BBO72643.1 NADH oxidase [Desulfosarcina widdelii]
MDTNRARKLFDPIRIGTLKLKNRVIMGAMVTNFATKDGFVTDRLIDYHVNIAKGGCALNVTENAYVSLDGKRIMNGLGAYDDKLVAGLKRLAQGVHAVDGKISLQIMHGGRECSSNITGLQPIGPTDLVSRYSAISKESDLPRQMTIEDIGELVERFGKAGRRAREAGFDSVEIHAAHGYLISQFLSPYSNKRTDRYGGDEGARATFLLEIIGNIKKKAGADFPVFVKLNMNDYVKGGTIPDQAEVTIRLAVEEGADAIITSVGLHESRPYMIIPPMSVKNFVNVPYSERAKKIAKVPVGVVGRITDPIRAARVIEEEKADFVVLARSLLCDPEWPNKAREGKFKDIRQCVGCNQGCIDMIHKMKPFCCLQNPAIGREKEFEVKKAKNPKRIAVIGGGPGGLEAARVAALRGHKVTLYEKENKLGGQINIGSIPPHRKELQKVTDHLVRQVEKLGVEIKLGQEMTLGSIEALDMDLAILATGAVTHKPNIKGCDLEHVVFAFDVLDGKVKVSDKAVIIGGGLVGVETADFLCEKGNDVIIIEMLDTLAPDSGSANRVYFEDRFVQKKVELLLEAKVLEIDQDGITYLQKGWTRKILGVDTVIIAVGALPNTEIWDCFAGKREGRIFRIGDCIKPRNAMEAIYEGAKLAREI